MKALPDGAVVYLESRAMGIVGVKQMSMECSRVNAFFYGEDDDCYTAIRRLELYGLTGNQTGWRVWLEKPTMEDMFNA